MNWTPARLGLVEPDNSTYSIPCLRCHQNDMQSNDGWFSRVPWLRTYELVYKYLRCKYKCEYVHTDYEYKSIDVCVINCCLKCAILQNRLFILEYLYTS